MDRHFIREIEDLKKQIVTLGAIAEERVRLAVKSILQRDAKLADQVITGDLEIDQMEVDLEEECLKILALYQPVAIDLRFVIAVLKINSDLERIGDMAVNIAERAEVLAHLEEMELPLDILMMAEKTEKMLKRSIDSLVNLDAKLASDVRAADDEVDDMLSDTFIIIREALSKTPDRADYLLQVLSAARYLERIADHATNIAEDVLYMIEGKIVRHRPDRFESTSPKEKK
jgi:phosphate transport system protein